MKGLALAKASGTRLPSDDDDSADENSVAIKAPNANQHAAQPVPELEDWSGSEEAETDHDVQQPALCRLRRAGGNQGQPPVPVNHHHQPQASAAHPIRKSSAAPGSSSGLDELLTGMDRLGLAAVGVAGSGTRATVTDSERWRKQPGDSVEVLSDSSDGGGSPPTRAAAPPKDLRPGARDGGSAAPLASAPAAPANDLVLQPSNASGGASAPPRPFVLRGSIATRLYPHQTEGIRWLWSLHQLQRGGILGCGGVGEGCKQARVPGRASCGAHGGASLVGGHTYMRVWCFPRIQPATCTSSLPPAERRPTLMVVCSSVRRVPASNPVRCAASPPVPPHECRDDMGLGKTMQVGGWPWPSTCRCWVFI